MRAGYRYDEAVFLGNLHKVVGEYIWNDTTQRNEIINKVCTAIDDYSITKRKESKKEFIAQELLDYGIDLINSDKLYHPSQVEGYKIAEKNKNGILQLGSPRTSSIRNPMAMRALFRLRTLINVLLREGKIDKNTVINIEMARELNDANKRKAIKTYQEEQEKKHIEYTRKIKELYKEETGKYIEPTDEEILKYQLWEEQNHTCLYTQATIGISEFIGGNTKYDIEHTVPRSRGGDNSQANKTLCNSKFNREIKRTKLPSELASKHQEILAVIEELGWKEKIVNLEKQIALQTRKSKNATTKESKDKAIQQRHYLKMQLDYWQDKLSRFTITDINSGFSKRQGIDIGIISRYARMFLQTAFNKVHTVKGSTTADFRKMWGLQEEYTKKERVNHIHHCIDAITIACISDSTYKIWKQYNENEDSHYFYQKERPVIEKPWKTFTEDIKKIINEVLISHHTPDNMPKLSRKKLRIRGKVQRNEANKIKYTQGDNARRALHLQTFYGAIMRDEEIKYVIRKPISSLESSDIDKIVDEAIKECVKEAYKREGKNALQKPICFNKEKGVYIKKVRIYAPSVKQPINLKKHQFESKHTYKQNYYVANDSNYCIAIYEGYDEKGRIKRGFEVVNNLNASKFFNKKNNNIDIVPLSDENDYPLKYIIKSGTMVLFYEETPEELYYCNNQELTKRLYKVTGFSTLSIKQGEKYYKYGTLTLKHHQEARPAGELKAKNGVWKINEDYRAIISLYHTQFNAFVEGYDFKLTTTGEIKFTH